MYRSFKIGILVAALSATIGATSSVYAKSTLSSNNSSKQIAEVRAVSNCEENNPFKAKKGAFNSIPRAYKWISDSKAVFSYSGLYTDKNAFAVDVAKSRSASRWKIETGVKAPEKGFELNEEIEKMYAQLTEIANKNPEKTKTHNSTYPYYSPDSTKIAITFLNDLYVYEVKEDKLTKLTFDGSNMIMNGYASWVYFEEIFGRPTKYKAFWWSPDSKKIAYYQFDNSPVPMFPIYSPFGQDGKLINTRYPKAGRDNPYVKVGVIDLAKAMSSNNEKNSSKDFTVWADFDYDKDGYFGTPFWGKDSKELFVSREPRIQNTLDLYSISIDNGSKKHIYHETYKPAWLDWIAGMLFTDEGLYMVRSFETGWEQIYFLSYDGKTLKKLTDGKNWRTSLERVDSDGRVYFVAERDSDVRKALYTVDNKGNIQALTDPEYNVSKVEFSPNGKYFITSLSNYKTPTTIWMAETARLIKKDNMISVNGLVSATKATESQRGVPHKELFCSVGEGAKSDVTSNIKTRDVFEVANLKGENYNEKDFALPNLIYLTTKDGLTLPATITYPIDFDPAKKYPVHVDLYGGPNTPLVRESWRTPSEYNQWWSQNGIIEAVIDCRAAGHNGHLGMDQVYKHLNTIELEDFKAWARYFQSLPYVRKDKIGVEGFSFGGTMTSMLVFTAPELFHYGIAGGGVYDWALYDTHYTERFMETPQTNPDGYDGSKVLNYVKDYVVNQKPGYSVNEAVEIEPVMLKITHGTADDNVHYQQTLQLIDELHKHGKEFEFMIYPDGKHGYHGYQGSHFLKENRKFWLKYLCK